MMRMNGPLKHWLQPTRLLSGVLLIGVLVTTACSGGASASEATVAVPDGAQQIALTVGNSMSFDPATITVTAGQPVYLTLRNGGQLPHDFALTDGVAQPLKITATGGQTSSGVFTIDKPGTFTFVCSMPGHASAGMQGTITAK
jgi:nitrite reductase (NO-forming)